MEKKGNFFLLLLIIAILTLIIAALVTFIMLVGITAPAQVASNAGGEGSGYTGPPIIIYGEPPDEASLSTMQLIASNQPLNLMTDNPAKPSYALVELSIKYFNKIDGIKDVPAKIDLNKANLQEIVTTYFMAMSVEEFSRFETKTLAKNDLKRELNTFLLTTIPGEKDRRKVTEVVYDVVFSAWNYQ